MATGLEQEMSASSVVPWSLGSRYYYRSRDREPAVQQMLLLAERTGLSFFCVDAHAGTVLAKTREDLVELLPWSVLSQLGGITSVRVIELRSGLVFYAVPLPDIDDLPVIAVGYVVNSPAECPVEMRMLGRELNWSDADINDWWRDQPSANPQLLERLLVAVVDGESRQNTYRSEIAALIKEVERSCEELSVLHDLTASLTVSRSPVELAQLCLSGMSGLIEAGGSLVILEDMQGEQHVLRKGHVPLDDESLQRLVSRFAANAWNRPLIRNDLTGTLMGADFPGLDSLMLTRITDGIHASGWILLCNHRAGHEFGCIESGLLRTMATILATHLRNQQLYEERSDLLMQFISSLVSTLDARDPYTCGHSERVARIARRIGKEMGLPDEDLEDLYRSGLLHDIGKIGINDAVLRKPEALTREEFEHVKQHPMIGYRILSKLTGLQRLLPGVRHHHEDFNGNGYPDRLAGEKIPLMARIMAVADACDAMRSDRPYRAGMPLEKVENIFKAGSGQQWDPQVIEAYFRCREDVQLIVKSQAKQPAPTQLRNSPDQ